MVFVKKLLNYFQKLCAVSHFYSGKKGFMGKKLNFSRLAFADYSGSTSEYGQRRHIALAACKLPVGRYRVRQDFTRETLREEAGYQLQLAEKQGGRLLFGVDHNFSFPEGFFQALYGTGYKSWREYLTVMMRGSKYVPPLKDRPKDWAAAVNDYFKKVYALKCGPFWGPGFGVLKRPDFPFGDDLFHEYRLIERQLPRMQPVFKLGGAGAVGLQTLCGIYHLWRLLNDHPDIFCWPLDGIKIPPDRHVFVEIYPGFYNVSVKSDRNDALYSLLWFRDKIRRGELKTVFLSAIPEKKIERVRHEGWVPGIKYNATGNS